MRRTVFLTHMVERSMGDKLVAEASVATFRDVNRTWTTVAWNTGQMEAAGREILSIGNYLSQEDLRTGMSVSRALAV